MSVGAGVDWLLDLGLRALQGAVVLAVATLVLRWARRRWSGVAALVAGIRVLQERRPLLLTLTGLTALWAGGLHLVAVLFLIAPPRVDVPTEEVVTIGLLLTALATYLAHRCLRSLPGPPAGAVGR